MAMHKNTRDAIEIILAFIVAWFFYQGLALATGTSMPIVSVASESMEPILYKGDLIFVLGPDNLRVGDVVIYNPESGCFTKKETIIHRIIDIKDEKITTKGDNNPGPDPCPVALTQIRGKVALAVPLLGYPRTMIYDIFGI